MSKIEWLQRPGTIPVSWNLLSGCTKVSPACDNCWALAMSWRIQNNPKRPERYEKVALNREWFEYDENLDASGSYHEQEWTGRVNLDYGALEAPYRWRKPRTVFVQSMGDLFHERVPDEFIDKVMAVIQLSHQHTFLILTKRAERMAQYFERLHGEDRFVWLEEAYRQLGVHPPVASIWPMPWLWLGVTAENQEQADKRIPLLLQTPAAVRWVSVEPMLGAINLGARRLLKPYPTRHFDKPRADPYTGKDRAIIERPRPGLDWIVIGAESGPNRRPMENEWALDLVHQCDDAGVPVFCKQIHTGHQNIVSKDPEVWPVELRRREWPK